MADMLSGLIEPLQFDCVCAYTGERALELFEKGTFALAIIDYSMQPMDGLEVISRIRAQDAKIPLVLMSGYCSQEISESAGLVGANRIVEKPFNVRHLMDELKELTEGQSSQLD